MNIRNQNRIIEDSNKTKITDKSAGLIGDMDITLTKTCDQWFQNFVENLEFRL